MGQLWAHLRERFYRKTTDLDIKIGMLGLDNAGKTTILYQLKGSLHPEEVVPTIGFNVENITYGRHVLNIWDVSGGKPKTRILWKHYNQNTKAIIFVVDSADLYRLPMAVEELKWLWQRSELSQAIFLIFANKQDLPNALDAYEIVKAMELNKLPFRLWAVQECCALTGQGLIDGIKQLMELYEMRQKNFLSPFKRRSNMF